MKTTFGLPVTAAISVSRSMSTQWMAVGILLFAISAAARANDGVLDVTCGTGGKVTVDVFGSTSNAANAAAVQADGKIVVAGAVSDVAGDFALVRYDAGGSLDSSFGSGGIVRTDFSGRADLALALAIQSDGKIVAAGFAVTSTSDFALARYNSDGSLDSSFGSGGKVTTDFFLRSDGVGALAIQGDGKIVAAGTAGNRCGQPVRPRAVQHRREPGLRLRHRRQGDDHCRRTR
jgi:uncharacterized delta-60 repeat protein